MTSRILGTEFLPTWDRFSETESIAMLVMFLSRYKITVLKEDEFPGETREEEWDRVFEMLMGLTLT